MRYWSDEEKDKWFAEMRKILAEKCGPPVRTEDDWDRLLKRGKYADIKEEEV